MPRPRRRAQPGRRVGAVGAQAVRRPCKVPTSFTRCQPADRFEMGSGLIFASALLVALVLSACGPPPARDDGAPPCERACLEDLVTAYLRALVARNPSSIPLANGATFVEDMQPVAIGAGTWTSITGVGGYRHIVADPST